MEFRVLGPLEVSGGAGPLPLGGAKQRALLALLVLDANHAVSRERLVDGLWGEDPPKTAVEIVQVHVHRLRKLLPEGTLLTHGPGYELAAAPEALDLFPAPQPLAEAGGVEPEAAARLLREALALGRGPALADLDEPFARLERGRLEELRLISLEERIEADLAL